MKTRRGFLTAGAVSAIAALSGCASAGSSALTRRFSYEERIDNLLFVPSNAKLVVVGERYHYLFDDAGAITKVLDAPFAKALGASFGVFTVDPSNRIQGSYTIRPRRALSAAEADEARRRGFVFKDDEGFVLDGSIGGQRYSATPLAVDIGGPTSLNRNYRVVVDVMGYPPSDRPDSHPLTQAAGVAGLVLLAPVIVLAFLLLDPCITCK